LAKNKNRLVFFCWNWEKISKNQIKIAIWVQIEKKIKNSNENRTKTYLCNNTLIKQNMICHDINESHVIKCIKTFKEKTLQLVKSSIKYRK